MQNEYSAAVDRKALKVQLVSPQFKEEKGNQLRILALFAKRARGTPRIAGRLLRRVVDFVTVEGNGRLTQTIADRALTRLGVDNLGLDGGDRRYMALLAENYGGGPVGVETIAAALSEARDAIEEVIEPFLLQQGLILRTPRGRMLGAKAWRHMGLEPPKAPGQTDLFET